MHCLIAIVLSSLSALLDIIGLAIPYWYNYSADGISVHFGLWKACVAGTCLSFPDGKFNVIKVYKAISDIQ